jgi:hypothetical protein
MFGTMDVLAGSHENGVVADRVDYTVKVGEAFGGSRSEQGEPDVAQSSVGNASLCIELLPSLLRRQIA